MTREEAIERLKNARSKCVSSLPEIQEMYDMFDKAIEALETQKIGHWIRWYNQKDFGLYIEKRENVFCYDKEQIIRLIIDKHISELKGENNEM